MTGLDELQDEQRQRLTKTLRDARVEAGWTSRAAWAREADVDNSTMQIIEGARPGNVGVNMLNHIGVLLGWPLETWRRIADGETPPPVQKRGTVKRDTDPLSSATDVELLTELLHRATRRDSEKSRRSHGVG